MKRKPWFQFYANDWLGDAQLNKCGPAAHGLLVRMMATAHHREPYGHLVDRGRALDVSDFVELKSWSARTVSKSWDELSNAGRILQTDEGVWYVPRMVEDHAYLLQQSELGKQGGNPALKGGLKGGDMGGLKPEQSRAEQSKTEQNIYTSEFVLWYDRFPLKKGKAAAAQKFKIAKIKVGVDKLEEGLDRLIEAIENGRQDPAFVKHPATWLNQGCWDDEYDGPQKKKSLGYQP